MAGRYSLRSIWDDLALPELALSFKLAIGPVKLVIAFCAILTVCLLGYLMDRCSQGVVVCSQNYPQYGLNVGQTELDLYIQDSSEAGAFIEQLQDVSYGDRQGVFSTLWDFVTSRFHRSTTHLLDLGNRNIFQNVQYVLGNIWECFRAVLWAFRFHPIYSLFFFSVSFIVFSFSGGAICRCASLEFAQEERPGLFEALHYAAEKFGSYLSAPLIPAGMVMVFSLVVLLVGLTAGIPWVGDLLLSVLFGFLLIFGAIIFLLVIGVAAGGLLLYPAIAYEGTSGLDSIGRSFSYVLNRPVWMFYYVFMSSIFGTFFYLVLRLIIFIVLRFTYGLLAVGMGMAGYGDKIQRVWDRPEFMDVLSRASGATGWSESVVSFVIYLFLLMIIGFLLAYVVSYVFSASTVIYALMRKKVDRIEHEQVYMHLEQVKE